MIFLEKYGNHLQAINYRLLSFGISINYNSKSAFTPTTQLAAISMQVSFYQQSSHHDKNWCCFIFCLCVLGLGAPTFSDPNMLKRAFRAWPASHSIRLKCRATGAPLLHYTWLKDGMEIPRRRMDPYLNTSIWNLKLKNLVPNDSGKYTCIVSNPFGSINHTYTLQVLGEFSKNVVINSHLPPKHNSEWKDWKSEAILVVK